MKTKLVVLITCFAFGCGLDTVGMGGSDEGAQPDVSDNTEPDTTEEVDAGPDVDAPDVFETAEDQTGEDGSDENEASDDDSDETTSEETSEDVADTAEDGEPEDAAGEDGETEDGVAEDGDVLSDGGGDPCTPPEIPPSGLHVFYCFTEDIRSFMSLWMQAERGGVPVFSWDQVPGCLAADARSLFCELPLRYNAVHQFKVEIPGTGIGWSCGPGLTAPLGTPRVWLDGTELAVSFADDGAGGCYHQFTTPPSP